MYPLYLPGAGQKVGYMYPVAAPLVDVLTVRLSADV